MAAQTDPRRATEEAIRAQVAEGGHTAAATEVLRAYGPEVRAFLLATHRDPDDADEVFALFCERIWRGMHGFAGESSARTWAYAIARNTSSNYRRDARVRGKRLARIDSSAELSALVARVRTETRPYLRTDAKDKLAAIRASLTDDDRDLLVLRVDRGLEWKELARAMSDEPLTEELATREAQRLRKRFQLLKARLVELGRREGLIE